MKYVRQFLIIMAVTCVGEILHYLINLPVPTSIYGMVLLLILLLTKVIKLEQVKDVALFLVEVMPAMFIPAGVELITVWSPLSQILVPVAIIMIVSTFCVLGASAKVTDLVIDVKERKEKAHE